MAIDPKTVCGVLVAYQPDKTLLARLEAHLGQLSHLVVIHNDVSAPAEWLADWAKARSNVTLLAHRANNLAAAQNVGIAQAFAHNAAAILLLDDDSEMHPGMLEALCQHVQDGVGLVAPAMIEQGSERPARHAVPWLKLLFRLEYAHGAEPIKNSFTMIASGSLIPLCVLEQVGRMDERFGIDYIDREFCLRLLSRGYRTLVVPQARLLHRIGRSQTHELAGLKLTARHHPPSRRYTIFRNRLRCWARYGGAVPAFLLYDLLACLYDLLRIALLEPEKAAQLHAAFGGMMAAITGKESQDGRHQPD